MGGAQRRGDAQQRRSGNVSDDQADGYAGCQAPEEEPDRQAQERVISGSYVAVSPGGNGVVATREDGESSGNSRIPLSTGCRCGRNVNIAYAGKLPGGVACFFFLIR